jgi:hypothetical protein
MGFKRIILIVVRFQTATKFCLRPVEISACRDSMSQRLHAVQNHLLSTHYRNLFPTVLPVNKFGNVSFCLFFVQLLHSTEIHRKFRVH